MGVVVVVLVVVVWLWQVRKYHSTDACMNCDTAYAIDCVPVLLDTVGVLRR